MADTSIDRAGAGEAARHPADAVDVGVAVLLGEPEALRQVGAHDVAVEVLDQQRRGARARGRRCSAMVVLPVPERPVNHRVKPERSLTLAPSFGAAPRSMSVGPASWRAGGARTRSSRRPAQRPARESSPGRTARVQGVQPMTGEARGRAAGCTGRRARTGSPCTSSSLQPASGWTLTTPRRVELEHAGAGAGEALRPADAGDPGVHPDERALERLDLAQRAAAVRVAAPELGALGRPPAPRRSGAGRSARRRGRSARSAGRASRRSRGRAGRCRARRSGCSRRAGAACRRAPRTGAARSR